MTNKYAIDIINLHEMDRKWDLKKVWSTKLNTPFICMYGKKRLND
jgi:hypothetical protein